MASAAPDSSTASSKEIQCRRKRLRHEENWAKKKWKIAKDKGESYSTSAENQKAAKDLVCLTCQCPFSCSENVDEVEQQRIFQEFYEIGSHDAQNKYLYGLISVMEVKRHTKRKKL